MPVLFTLADPVHSKPRFCPLPDYYKICISAKKRYKRINFASRGDLNGIPGPRTRDPLSLCGNQSRAFCLTDNNYCIRKAHERKGHGLFDMAPELKPSQTPKENKFPTGHAFEIILPNLIHKSKKRNLK